MIEIPNLEISIKGKWEESMGNNIAVYCISNPCKVYIKAHITWPDKGICRKMYHAKYCIFACHAKYHFQKGYI